MGTRVLLAVLLTGVLSGPLSAHGPTRINAPACTLHEQALLADCSRQARAALAPHFPLLAALPVTVHGWPARAPGAGGDLYNAGRSSGRTILIQNIRLLISQDRLRTVLLHEFTHLALATLGRGALPLWLEEGCALYYSGERIQPLQPFPTEVRSLAALSAALTRAAARGGFTGWQALEPLYGRALRITGFMARDQERFLPFLTDLKQGAPFAPALARRYGLTPEALWQRHE